MYPQQVSGDDIGRTLAVTAVDESGGAVEAARGVLVAVRHRRNRAGETVSRFTMELLGGTSTIEVENQSATVEHVS